MNPRYGGEHSRWEDVRARRADYFEALRLKLLYADMAQELSLMFAMLQLKRGCRR
jgi:hypothetical protein